MKKGDIVKVKAHVDVCLSNGTYISSDMHGILLKVYFERGMKICDVMFPQGIRFFVRTEYFTVVSTAKTQ